MRSVKPVFYDLGFTENESLALVIKADIYIKILNVIKAKKIKSKELEKVLGIPQPRVSELLNGKFSSASIEKLLSYLEKLGIDAKISFKPAKAS